MSTTKEDHILKIKDAWRNAEEEDQVICDCYSILSNQLILLLSSLCLMAILILELLSVEPHFTTISLLFIFALDTLLTVFLIISWPLFLSSAVFHVYEQSKSGGLYDLSMFIETKRKLKTPMSCLIYRHEVSFITQCYACMTQKCVKCKCLCL